MAASLSSARVLQRRIATDLGLAISTVSRALAGTGRMAEATRMRVQERAKALSYQPRPRSAAWLTVRHRPRLVAIVTPGIARSAPLLTWNRVTAELQHLATLGQPVELRTLDDRALGRWADELAAGAAPHADGILFLNRHRETAVARIAARVPSASLIFDYPRANLDVIGTDQLLAGRLQAEHLLALGHRRIGWLGWEMEHSWCQQRFAGYVAALAAQSLLPEPRDCLCLQRGGMQTPGSPASGASAGPQAIAALLARAVQRTHRGVTAWVTASDFHATRLIQTLTRHGLEVPRAVSVSGIDHLPPRDDIPLLTSVRQPLEECTREAVALLSWRVAHPVAPRRALLLAPTLMPGASTAAPQAGNRRRETTGNLRR
jgi:LacI family transcriptional regulator